LCKIFFTFMLLHSVRKLLTRVGRVAMLGLLSHYTRYKMNTLDILKAGRNKIADEKNWCQGEFAKDIKGYCTYVLNVNACSWCSVGVLRSIPDVDSIADAVSYLSKAMGGTVPDYNDYHSHAEVLSKWDEAIAAAEKETK
jgi:hypothetical protein